MKLINAKIVGLRNMTSSKTNKSYTIAYLEYSDDQTKGIATAQCFLPETMFGVLDEEIQGAFSNGRFSVLEM